MTSPIELWHEQCVARQGRKAGRGGSSHVELVLAKHRGSPRPVFDPVHNPAHECLAKQVDGTRTRELKVALDEVEEKLTVHGSSSWLFNLLVALFFGEVVGAMFLCREVGVPAGPERFVLAMMLASFLFMLTHWSRESVGLPVVGQPSSARPGLSRLVLWAYALLVLSVGIVRIHSVGTTEGGVDASSVAGCIIMIAASIGPAFLADHVMFLYAPVIHLVKKRRRVRISLKEESRDHQHAVTQLAKIEEAQRLYDERLERLRATYELARQQAMERAS